MDSRGNRGVASQKTATPLRLRPVRFRNVAPDDVVDRVKRAGGFVIVNLQTALSENLRCKLKDGWRFRSTRTMCSLVT